MDLPPQGSLQLGHRQYAILQQIPSDRWITSREISKYIEYNQRVISAVIRSQLLYKYVDRRPIKKSTGATSFEYKRKAIFTSS